MSAKLSEEQFEVLKVWMETLDARHGPADPTANEKAKQAESAARTALCYPLDRQ